MTVIVELTSRVEDGEAPLHPMSDGENVCANGISSLPLSHSVRSLYVCHIAFLVGGMG